MLRDRLESFFERYPSIQKAAGIFKGQQVIVIDYPFTARPRYGYGRPPHPQIQAILDEGRADYRMTLAGFLPYRDELLSIPLEYMPGSLDPCWKNQSLPALDAIAIYCFIAAKRPGNFFEVGSGNSTKFARKAIVDHNLDTRLVSIDPFPWMAEIQKVCDLLLQQPLEETELSIFNELNAGDILFVDGSHRVFMNSDVTVAFLDVLPRLKSGVLVGFHDILLPYDYTHGQGQRGYSEQYMLAAYMLGMRNRLHIVLPGHYVSLDPELSQALAPILDQPLMETVHKHGQGFWFLVD